MQVDNFVESLDIRHEKTFSGALLPNSEGVVELEMGKDDGDRSGSASGEDDEKGLVDDPFINCSSFEDEERDQARDKVVNFVQLKKKIQEDVGERDNEWRWRQTW